MHPRGTASLPCLPSLSYLKSGILARAYYRQFSHQLLALRHSATCNVYEYQHKTRLYVPTLFLHSILHNSHRDKEKLVVGREKTTPPNRKNASSRKSEMQGSASKDDGRAGRLTQTKLLIISNIQASLSDSASK